MWRVPDWTGLTIACYDGFRFGDGAYTVRFHLHIGPGFIGGWAFGGLWAEGIDRSGININDDVNTTASLRAVADWAYGQHRGGAAAAVGAGAPAPAQQGAAPSSDAWEGPTEEERRQPPAMPPGAAAPGDSGYDDWEKIPQT